MITAGILGTGMFEGSSGDGHSECGEAEEGCLQGREQHIRKHRGVRRTGLLFIHFLSICMLKFKLRREEF